MKTWLLHIAHFPGNEYMLFRRVEDAHLALDQYCTRNWQGAKLPPNTPEQRVQTYFRMSHERYSIVDLELP